MAPILPPPTVKFFVYDPTSRNAPWSYKAGPALKYCLDVTSAALLSPPILDLYVSTLLGEPFLSSPDCLSKNFVPQKALTNAVRTLLTSSLIPLNLTRVPEFARTIPSPSTHNHLPTILLDNELVFSIDTANDPFLCFTLLTMIMYEVNQWLRLRLLSGYGLINCDYGSTVVQADAIRVLRRGVEIGKQIGDVIFKKRLFAFEQKLLGGVTVLIMSDKDGFCHYIDGFALEKKLNIQNSKSEVRILESRSDIVNTLAQLYEGRASLPLFDFEALRIDNIVDEHDLDHNAHTCGPRTSKKVQPMRQNHPKESPDSSEFESELESSISEPSEWDEPDDGLRNDDRDSDGGYIVVS